MEKENKKPKSNFKKWAARLGLFAAGIGAGILISSPKARKMVGTGIKTGATKVKETFSKKSLEQQSEQPQPEVAMSASEAVAQPKAMTGADYNRAHRGGSNWTGGQTSAPAGKINNQ